MADIAGEKPDEFGLVCDQVAFHGLLDPLVGMMMRAMPHLRVPGNVVPWAVQAYAEDTAHLLLLQRLARGEDPRDAEFVERVQGYAEIIPERFFRFADRVRGTLQGSWTLADFAFAPVPEPSEDDQEDWEDDEEWDDDEDWDGEEESDAEEGSEQESTADVATTGFPDAESAPRERRRRPEPPRDPARENLLDLSAEFLGYLWRAETMPLPRAEMGRELVPPPAP
jgi:hypothetical protein